MSDFSVFEETKRWAKKNKFPLHAEDDVDSTNRWAKAEFEETKDKKSLFLADFQTSGRGRFDRTWTSPNKGTSLLSTWCFKTKKPMQMPFPLQLGLSLYESLEMAWPGVSWSLKAPNDVYLDQKKVAGLLIESTSLKSEHFLYVGLGLNVLSNPEGVDISGNMTKELDQAAISTRWVEFLDQWSASLERLTSTQTTVQETELSRIRFALNKFPFLKEKYTRISPEGDLYTQTQKISWQDL